MTAHAPNPAVMMVLESAFPVRGGGGAESQVLTLGRRILERGVGVQVVVPMVAGGPQIARETVDGLDVTRIEYPKIRFLGGLIMLVKLAWLLFQRRHEYSVIHAHIAHNMAAVCAVVGSWLGKRVVVKITGAREMWGGILDEHPNLAARLKTVALRRATWMQAISQRIRLLLIARGFDPARILLLPNGVDVDRFLDGKDDGGFRRQICGDTDLVAVFVGRLVPEKGVDLMLQAWSDVFRGCAGAKLVLVGEGAQKEVLRELAKRLGIAGQVIFAGHSDDVSRYLAIADLALLTSLNEGLSNSLLEYMAAGLPVIGSRVSGTEDFISPGETGWLFDPGRQDQLSACLATAAAAGPALAAMGAQARQRIVSLASVEAVTRELFHRYGFEIG